MKKNYIYICVLEESGLFSICLFSPAQILTFFWRLRSSKHLVFFLIPLAWHNHFLHLFPANDWELLSNHCTNMFTLTLRGETWHLGGDEGGTTWPYEKSSVSFVQTQDLCGNLAVPGSEIQKVLSLAGTLKPGLWNRDAFSGTWCVPTVLTNLVLG